MAEVGIQVGSSVVRGRSHLRSFSFGIVHVILTLHTSIKLGVVVNHQHDLPFEDIVVHQPAADTRYALVVLHLLELARQESCRS